MRLLVATYGYPPTPFVGSARWAAMVAHMRKLGHEVTVVTTSCYGSVAGEVDVVRTPDLFAIPAVSRLLDAVSRSEDGRSAAEPALPPLHERLLVPDPKVVGWLPGAAAAVRGLLHQSQFDCMITASPFESTHLLGILMGRGRPAWVADLRDGWTIDSWRSPLPWKWQRRLDRGLERRSLGHADAVSTATAAIAADLKGRLVREVHHVTNGWDPDLEPEVECSPVPAVAADRTTLVYTGSLWRTIGQNPAPLFDALRRLRGEAPEILSQLELVIAGPLSPIESQRLDDFGLHGVLRHVGQLPRLEAVALQRRGDALVLVTSTTRNVVTGKIFEYLASGRPILVLGGEDEASAVVKETQAGVVVPRDDAVAIARALHDIVGGRLADACHARGLERYRYPAPAQAMLQVVREAVKCHRGRTQPAGWP
jgi:glycosyltransferase involved in cell wall biosynthesis